MGLYAGKPKRIYLTITDAHQDLYVEFNKWCIIHGLRREDGFADLIQDRLRRDPIPVDRIWVSWDVLVAKMKEAKFSLNRTTFWNYRKRGLFVDDVRTDGVSALYDADAIIHYFTGSSLPTS